MKRILFYFITFLILIMVLSPASCRPEYVSRTGQSCSSCHVNITTGELNDAGEAFFVTDQWPPGEVSSSQKILFSFAGFIHLLSSMILVGSMVFVHIIHTPGVLALSGVPKNELKLGWISLFLIGVSGFYLIFTKFQSIDDLLSSSSGRLVAGKIILFSIMVTFASLVTFVINRKLKSTPHYQPLVEEIDSEMTLENLEKYNGSNGETFVVYAGLIFDISESRLWKKGKHMGKHQAGTDLTHAFAEAPHGPEVLDKYQVVGRLKMKYGRKPPAIVGLIFKILATINFICAVLAVFLSGLIAWPL